MTKPISDGEVDKALDDLKDIISERIYALKDTIDGRVLLEQQRDQMTGLFNDAAFQATLSDVVGTAEIFWVAFVEIDKFKSINSTFGYKNANQVLIHVASLLGHMAKCFPGKADAFHPHGDEYYLLGTVVGDPDHQSDTVGEILSLLHKKIRAIQIPIVDKGVMACKVSIGWLMGSDIPSVRTSENVQAAMKMAVDEAKKTRDCIVRYSSSFERADWVSSRSDCGSCGCRFTYDVDRSRHLRDNHLNCPNCGTECERPPEDAQTDKAIETIVRLESETADQPDIATAAAAMPSAVETVT